MKYFKLFLKILFGVVGIFILFIVILHSGESYETISQNNVNEVIHVEIKNAFGKKISECPFNSLGFYHGHATSWSLFGGTIKSEGEYVNGYWHGQWKDFDNSGNLTMVREWNMGKLNKVFTYERGVLKEISKEKWPKYVDITQRQPQRINN